MTNLVCIDCGKYKPTKAKGLCRDCYADRRHAGGDDSLITRRKTGQWAGVRGRVLARDGGVCRTCGEGSPGGKGMVVDHITARADWPPGVPGVDDLDNLQTLCRSCHAIKTAMERAARKTQGRTRTRTINKQASKTVARVGNQNTTTMLAENRNATRTPDFLTDGEASPFLRSGLSPDHSAPMSADVDGETPTPATLFATEPHTLGWTDQGPVWGLAYDSEAGVWPRFMTKAHPRATGTYGHDFIAWAEHPDQKMMNPKRSAGLRWWQKMVALRALEHDVNGNLCWPTVVLTVARQSGKSWLMRALLMWRTAFGESLFGETQTCLHVAHKIPAAQEVWRPATRWAMHHYGQRAVRFANGEQQISTPNGDRWVIQAATDGAGVSMSLSMALVDEAWRVKREVVDGAIIPTMAEAENPQLFLVSTAGDSLSDLMIAYRGQAIETAVEPDTMLIVEWSATPDDDPDDEASWRAASPHWSDKRRAAVATARKSATEGEFRSQWLNQWQPSIDASQALIPLSLWNTLAVRHLPKFGDDTTIVVGVEDNFGDGSSVALAWCDPDSNLIAGTVREFDRLPDAWLAVAEYRERWPNCRVEVGATLADDPLLVEVVGYDGAQRTGAMETRQALPLVRELAAQRRLVHDGNQALTRQVIALQVRASVNGGLGIVGIDQRRTDGVRAFARAVMSAQRSVGIAPAIY